MLDLKTILKDSVWIVKLDWGRVKGTYDEIKHYLDSDDLRDFDLCAVQPDHLKDFYDKYFLSDDYVSVQEFYHKVYCVKGV